MILTLTSPEELADKLRIDFDGDGKISHRAIAALARTALSRWGVATPDQLRRYIWRHVEACGDLDDDVRDRINAVLDRLVQFREAEEITVNWRTHYARTLPRWIVLTPTSAVLTGTAEAEALPDHHEATGGPSDLGEIVRRFEPREETLLSLRQEGFTEWTLGEWRGPSAHRDHLQRRGGRGAGLKDLWLTLMEQVRSSGSPVEDTATLRAVIGSPGGLFGKVSSPLPTGRWSEEIPNGQWCGARKGFSDAHWHPICLSVEAGVARVVDLYDWDEFSWALIARGDATGEAEVVHHREAAVSFSFPPPHQISKLMNLVGTHDGGWRWAVPGGLSAVWRWW